MNSNSRLDAYLRQLERAAAGLAPNRRRELVDEVSEHIEVALEAAGSRDDVVVRNVLERLGSPEDIVAVEADLDRRPDEVAPDTPPFGRYVVGIGEASGPWRGASKVIAVFLLALATVLLLAVWPSVRLAAIVSVPVLLVPIGLLVALLLAVRVARRP